MNEYHGAILTGEPLIWQLNNAQRERIGLPPVDSSWTLTEVPCGLLADRETYIYIDGVHVMRVISSSETSYEECCVHATLTEDGRIAPAKEGGKSVLLTAANLHKRRKVGVSLLFDANMGSGVILIKDHDRRQAYLELYGSETVLPRDIPGFARWLEEWCQQK